MDKSIHIQKRITLSSKIKEIIIDGISYLFIFLFIYTAYNKGMDFPGFVKSLARYPILEEIAQPLAYVVVAAEVFVSGLLLFPRTRKLGLINALFLMLSFSIALLFMVFIMDAQYCSCGGVLNSMNATEHIWFNAGFIVLAMIGIGLFNKKKINGHLNEEG